MVLRFRSKQLIVFCSYLEVSLGMRADRANVGSVLTNYDVAAVGALPYSVAFFREYKLALNVSKELSVSFFVFLFDSRYAFKQGCDVVETFFASRLSEFCVHIRPFVVFTHSSCQKVFFGGRNFAAVKELEPNFSVFLFVLSRFFEDSRDLNEAFFLCLACEIGVLISCLAFAFDG